MLDNKRIETLLSSEGLQNLTIGHVAGDWKAFDPVLSFSNIQLAGGREGVVRLGFLRVRLDSFRSMVNRSPVAAEIEVIGVNFTVLVDSNGVGVKGLMPGGSVVPCEVWQFLSRKLSASLRPWYSR